MLATRLSANDVELRDAAGEGTALVFAAAGLSRLAEEGDAPETSEGTFHSQDLISRKAVTVSQSGSRLLMSSQSIL